MLCKGAFGKVGVELRKALRNTEFKRGKQTAELRSASRSPGKTAEHHYDLTGLEQGAGSSVTDLQRVTKVN